MVTKSEAIANFLNAMAREDLASLYNLDMEVQVNVAQDNGERIDSDYKGNKWHGWTDGMQTWKSYRIPHNAATEPEYEDSEIRFDLALHVEGIGMTGWDWKNRLSRWIAFDFDALVGHSDKHLAKLTSEELDAVRAAASEIPWVTIRRSTSGKGLHLYVFLEPVETRNHKEHAALARAVLGMMSAITGFSFSSKVDVCGSNMWVWHRKMVGTKGLELLKPGTVLSDIPPNWRDHISVVNNTRRRNLPQNVADSGVADIFEDLVSRRPHVPLDSEHKRLIEYLRENNALWWWDQDQHMLVTHTHHLEDAHKDLGLHGFFATDSRGTNLDEQNCFCFPMRKGAWTVRRYTPGVREHASWDQDGAGWTRCFLNREPDMSTASRALGGLEDPKGGFIFQTAETASESMRLLGVYVDLPPSVRRRPAHIKEHKDGRVIMEVKSEAYDAPDTLPGWLNQRNNWIKIFRVQAGDPTEPDVSSCDDIVRHVVTTEGESYGWVVKADSEWRVEPLLHVKAALGSMGFSAKEITSILGSAIFKAWKIVNKPFQGEYPGDREWNRGAAQFRFSPADRDDLSYPTWMRVLNHTGSGLDDAVKIHPWCRANGVMTGGDYLKLWLASLFQNPTEPLPYLFLHGPQDSGKSILHEAAGRLLTKGVKRADAALISQAGFNAELEGAILCVIEETELGGQKNKFAYNRIKDWVTSREVLIHKKGETPYHITNTSHWIQCLPADQWILTNQGPRRIANLVNQPALIYSDSILEATNGFFSTGYKEVFLIEMKNGHSYKSTGDHLVLVQYDDLRVWRRADSLVPGDKICLQRHRNLEWGIPSATDADDGYALGQLLGDGTIFRRSRRGTKDYSGEVVVKTYLYEEDEHLLPHLLPAWYGATPRRGPRGECLILEGGRMKDVCSQYGLVDKKLITQEMQEASSVFIRNLLTGLFDSDGCCPANKKEVHLAQSDKDMLQVVQRLLLYFGINSHIYKMRDARALHIHRNRYITNSKPAYELVIRNRENLVAFAERIGFHHQKKQENLVEVINSWRRKAIDDEFTDVVQSVKSVGVQPVFDVTCPRTHAFSCNGVTVHNCSNDHNACPVFPGDTRITMIFVDALDPLDMIPKRRLEEMLDKEAPDFLAEILRLELPAPCDRLGIPVIETQDKRAAAEMNRTPLEIFIAEKCVPANGRSISVREFYDKFQEWCDQDELSYWTKNRVGKEFPPQYPKARLHQTGHHHIGNIAWTGSVDAKVPTGSKFVARDDYLELVRDPDAPSLIDWSQQ